MTSNYNNIHFIGIGGTGMSGIALILLKQGYNISGSDIKASSITSRLEREGAKIYIGHKSENTVKAEAIVISTAIPSDNPELIEAKKKKLPVFHRADILNKLMKKKKGIAVSGAHGKTTTTSMISLILEQNNYSPTVLIGGELNDIGGNASLGSGEYLVAEADESDGSFLKFSPYISIVTNIEDDHLDFYGSLDNIIKAFSSFLSRLNPEGFCVLGIDNKNVKLLKNKFKNLNIITFGIDSKEADYRAENIVFEGTNAKYDLFYKNKKIDKISLVVPGVHNVYNSLAAIATCLEVGVKIENVRKVLSKFIGAKRRFQIIGKYNNITIVDDYAHHPTEIKMTLKAAKESKPRRLIAIFQPHRYTRTEKLKVEFGRAFELADEVIISDIYAAGENPIPGVSSKTIIENIDKSNKSSVKSIDSKAKIEDYLKENLKSGDLILTLGAGDIWEVGHNLARHINNRSA